MGAQVFEEYGEGRTMNEAFRAAHDQAQWEFGHGGYTGTIAEKGSAVEFSLPEGVTAEDFAAALHDGLNYWSMEPGRGLVEVKGKTPEWVGVTKYSPYVWAKALKIYDDKWGPAVALKAGKGRWLFCGYASE